MSANRVEEPRCARCERPFQGRAAYRLGSGAAATWKCLRCALFDRGIVRRSSRVALLIGSILVALNQGDQLLAGSFPWATAWYKIPLTYLVPYCVATYGALSNGYRARPE